MIKISCRLHCTKNLCIPLMLCLRLTSLHGQQSINTSGGEAIGTGGSLSYTIGQVAYTSDSGSTGSVCQGVQQPYLEIMVHTANPQSPTSIRLFPNPSSAYTNIAFDTDTDFDGLKAYSYQLFDIYGHFLGSERIHSAIQRIPVADLVAGMYMLKVFRSNQLVKTIRFIKSE